MIQEVRIRFSGIPFGSGNRPYWLLLLHSKLVGLIRTAQTPDQDHCIGVRYTLRPLFHASFHENDVPTPKHQIFSLRYYLDEVRGKRLFLVL